MKAKKFIPLSILAILGAVSLAACRTTDPASSETPIESSETPVDSSDTPTSSSNEEVTYSLAISNKEELTAEWHAGDANRTLDITLTPAGNAAALINSGRLTITSSDPNVVYVSGKSIMALKAGTATITATIDGNSDSVELTISESLTAPDIVATTVESVIAAEDTSGTYCYALQGTVSSWKDSAADGSKYGSFNLSDGTNTILVYSATATGSALSYSLSDKAYKFQNPQDFLTNEYTSAIEIGDTVDILAIRSDYNGTKELKAIIRAVNGKVIPNEVKTSDELIATEADAYTAYSLTGKITAWKNDTATDGTKYGNFYVATDGATDTKGIYVYGCGATSTALAIDYTTKAGGYSYTNAQDWLTNEYTKDLTIGSEVTIVGYRLDYTKNETTTIEFTGYIVTPEEEADVTITADKTSISIGGTATLSAVAKDESTSFTWTSSDTSIATVDASTGVVTGVAAGEATITATTASGLTGTIKIYVVEEVVKTTVDALVDGTGIDASHVYEVTGILEGKSATDVYGNGYLTDPTSGKSIKIYGNTTTASAIAYSGSTPTYTNAQDATTTLADIDNGDKITVKCVYSTSHKNISAVTTAHEAYTGGVTVSAASAENGTVTLDKESYSYGDTVTVTATPNTGYKVSSVSVAYAYKTVSVTSNEDGTYSFSATQVNTITVTFADASAVVSSVTISADTLSQPSNAYTDEHTATVSGLSIKSMNVGNFGSGLQWRYKNSKASYIYNDVASEYAIKSIVITENSSNLMTKDTLLTYLGGTSVLSTASPDGSLAITATSDGVHTYTFEESAAIKYFNISHTTESGSLYIDSIVINFYVPEA